MRSGASSSRLSAVRRWHGRWRLARSRQAVLTAWSLLAKTLTRSAAEAP